MQFKRRLKSRTVVDLVPMIDVVFQLILFFLVSTTFAILPGITLQLPTSSTAEPTAMTRLIVSVLNRDEIYLNKDRVSLAELEQRLSKLSESERAEIKSVTLEADRTISYGLTISVLDVLRKSGFRGINLHTLEE
ncbi:ExbD/TolR family protein [Gracilinema caldarium]|uniref:Biopolymer transport protein ExbD/TolR n=1 Tax=Gracilinema caldarium (strain ATCC 51460 / DSM 7334 / H1) TaxID=744872 RepID=F8F0V2_GRAC1|nr:biopolymer transporter ExbD [Gracilinema caldarium]AEJ20238.1 Biopolymer transport protein ExbD/TolR [Gracilinema caldarium DSM 7334]